MIDGSSREDAILADADKLEELLYSAPVDSFDPGQFVRVQASIDRARKELGTSHGFLDQMTGGAARRARSHLITAGAALEHVRRETSITPDVARSEPRVSREPYSDTNLTPLWGVVSAILVILVISLFFKGETWRNGLILGCLGGFLGGVPVLVRSLRVVDSFRFLTIVVVKIAFGAGAAAIAMFALTKGLGPLQPASAGSGHAAYFYALAFGFLHQYLFTWLDTAVVSGHEATATVASAA